MQRTCRIALPIGLLVTVILLFAASGLAQTRSKPRSKRPNPTQPKSTLEAPDLKMNVLFPDGDPMPSAISYAQERGITITKSSDSRNSERRIALVIGNSAYKDSPLLNPVNDAKDMAQVLIKLEFEVMERYNLTQNEMKKAVRDFGEKIRGGGVGLFYYAGHGIQVNGQNYLVPIEAVIQSEHEVEYESIDVGLVVAQMESAMNSLNILILDACRNNPFAPRFRSVKQGLASINAPVGTLIAYATAPGAVASDGDGRNGLYTQELLRNMLTPELSIEDVFKRVRAAVQEKTQGRQVPWESSSLIGDFYFLGTSQNKAKPLSDAVTPITIFTTPEPNLEGTTWEESTPDSTRTFVFQKDVEGEKVALDLLFQKPVLVYKKGKLACSGRWRQEGNRIVITACSDRKFEGVIAGNQITGFRTIIKRGRDTSLEGKMADALGVTQDKVEAWEVTLKK